MTIEAQHNRIRNNPVLSRPARPTRQAKLRYNRNYREVIGLPKIGSILPHLEPRHMDWLKSNMPQGMKVGEYLVQAILEDAMNDDIEDALSKGRK